MRIESLSYVRRVELHSPTIALHRLTKQLDNRRWLSEPLLSQGFSVYFPDVFVPTDSSNRPAHLLHHALFLCVCVDVPLVNESPAKYSHAMLMMPVYKLAEDALAEALTDDCGQDWSKAGW